MALLALGLWIVSIGSAVASVPPPPAYEERCVKCHHYPGDGDRNSGPDLGQTKISYVEFKQQITQGSSWKTLDQKIKKYRNMVMPGQVGLSPDEIRALYMYVKSMAREEQEAAAEEEAQ
jgi:mono/diheme cytochrome c family protein